LAKGDSAFNGSSDLSKAAVTNENDGIYKTSTKKGDLPESALRKHLALAPIWKEHTASERMMTTDPIKMELLA